MKRARHTRHKPAKRGLGDVIEFTAQPIARIIGQVAGRALKNCQSCGQRKKSQLVSRAHEPATYGCATCGGGVSLLGKSAGPYQPQPPRPFVLREPEHERAIVWPWLSTAAVWEELRYSIRSVARFFEDQDCPLYIVGDSPPPWFRDGGRLKFIQVPEYKISNQEGLFAARAIIVQLAQQVIYFNDDIYLLKPTTWADMETALTEGELTGRGPAFRSSPNVWQQGLGMVADEMKRRGKERVWRFATHTPFLFEVEKSREILREYRLPHSGGFVSLYHNHWDTPHRPLTAQDKTMTLPNSAARYLNHKASGPDTKTKAALVALFPLAQPWEASAKASVVSLPTLGISIMAHPSRAAMTATLLKALGPVPVAEDDGRGLLANCEAAWSLADPSHDWHLVLQDDAILCTDFITRARAFLSKLTEPQLVSFYFGNKFTTRNLALNAMDEGKVTAPLMWGLALCIPSSWLPDMLAFYREQSRPDDDGRIADWLRATDRTATYALPCLVDHHHSPSLVGNSSGKRKAVAFLG